MEAPGLYLACMYVARDERLTSGGRGNVRLALFMDVDAEAAHQAALARARVLFPPSAGYTGHGAYIETAPLEWLRLVLPFVAEVEPYRPRGAAEPVRMTDEEWPDVLE